MDTSLDIVLVYDGGMQKAKLGDRYGLWTVLALPESGSRNALCRCDCGTEKPVNIDNIRTGKSTNCGCRRPEWAKRAGVSRRRRALYAGQKWGRLTVTSAEDREHVEVLCVCGTTKVVSSVNLFNGKTRSCGCLAQENRLYGPKHSTHGLKGHPLYRTWNDMVARCHNPDDSDYRYYGARGIGVCERWRDVRLFVRDIEASIGPRPRYRTLDRINNDGNYEPGNVKWSTRKEQANNRRSYPKGTIRPSRRKGWRLSEAGLLEVDAADAVLQQRDTAGA